MSYIMRKHTTLSECKISCAVSAQLIITAQLIIKLIFYTYTVQSLSFLNLKFAIFCAAWFVLDLVRNHGDRFFHDVL